jgi:hypothetical protein
MWYGNGDEDDYYNAHGYTYDYYSKGKAKLRGKGKSSGKYQYYDTNDDIMDGVPICYFDRSKHIHRTECVDPYEDIPRIMADDEDDYSCGCCSPDIEISGSLPDYCFATGDAADFSGGDYVPSITIPAVSGDAAMYASDFGCTADDTQTCGRQDIFVYGNMFTVCRWEPHTGKYETLCIHPSMQDDLVDDTGGRYTCGCCSSDQEGGRPSYCTS